MSSFISASSSVELPPRLHNGRQNLTNPIWGGGLYNDPRTSSTQSLTPSLPGYEEVERRILLVVYIHGFMGNDTSFQSFPAHVHRCLKLALCDSHVVHSKIYPRYKTYKTIDIARDNFSRWLEPLETPKTDVVLVGHSMGGLLAADVVLKPSTDKRYGYFRHRILGVVNLDAPLLGMHPGIVVSGISSLFRKNESPKSPGEASLSSPLATQSPSPDIVVSPMSSTVSELPPYFPPSSAPPAPFINPTMTFDPNFNPSFPNDVRMEERTWWGNVFHFVKKHSSENLIEAATNHIMSHLEFGGTMFDLNRLQSRYESVRRLEDVDDSNPTSAPDAPPRVRFIQYYTICNGFPKTPKEPKRQDSKLHRESTQSHHVPSGTLSTQDDLTEKAKVDPERETPEQHINSPGLSNSERSSLELLSPEPIPDHLPLETGTTTIETHDLVDSKTDREGSRSYLDNRPGEEPSAKGNAEEITDTVAALYLDLPKVPELPSPPEPVNLEQYVDKDARKLAEKEAKRVQKAYAQAVKDREKAVRDREKIIEKRKKKQAQESEKKAKEEKKRLKKEEAAAAKVAAAAEKSALVASPVSPDAEKALPSPFVDTANLERLEKDANKAKKPKERKFCNIARITSSRGQSEIDPKWIGVFMKDMDEVAAHTSLFFPEGEHYERLVGDVGETIAEWVRADMSKRAALGFQV
ncbi:hypothetical protein F5Y17DRAFT_29688 [Xylariaceae sp. FL0594]|nr:hypothetical protein F5Y17DRAFT_29688 [Xylariaceae sp. FL0594]